MLRFARAEVTCHLDKSICNEVVERKPTEWAPKRLKEIKEVKNIQGLTLSNSCLGKRNVKMGVAGKECGPRGGFAFNNVSNCILLVCLWK